MAALAPGDHTLAMRFEPPTVELLVDGEVVGAGEVTRTTWSRVSLSGRGPHGGPARRGAAPAETRTTADRFPPPGRCAGLGGSGCADEPLAGSPRPRLPAQCRPVTLDESVVDDDGALGAVGRRPGGRRPPQPRGAGPSPRTTPFPWSVGLEQVGRKAVAAPHGPCAARRSRLAAAWNSRRVPHRIGGGCPPMGWVAAADWSTCL